MARVQLRRLGPGRVDPDPWQVEKAKKGWIEDRRPNANIDPYVVSRLIVNTCCSALTNKV